MSGETPDVNLDAAKSLRELAAEARAGRLRDAAGMLREIAADLMPSCPAIADAIEEKAGDLEALAADALANEAAAVLETLTPISPEIRAAGTCPACGIDLRQHAYCPKR